MEASRRAAPPGYKVHRESTTEILVKSESKEVFINPIQEFNRDLSVLALRAWSSIFAQEKQMNLDKKRAGRQERASKKRKLEEIEETAGVSTTRGQNGKAQSSTDGADTQPEQYRFTLFEGLSATGLRSIRYAKEIPLLRWVQANDLLPRAADNIRMNVAWNGLAEPGTDAAKTESSAEINESGQLAAIPECKTGRVRVSQGDCCSVLYAHREGKDRFDAIDLDPYGTAAPFVDGAVQAVNDGGLLCVTCTDLAVLAGSNYPEKCYSNYGGVPAKAEYTHEVALRLLLHTIAQSAARYGRYIKPILCLSIDYYIRVFVRVYSGAAEVKKLASQTALVYVCHSCQSYHLQRLGKVVEKKNEAKGSVNLNYGFASGPPTSPQCVHCNGSFQLSGPMWADPIQAQGFIDSMLASLENAPADFDTATRIKGMLTVARHELPQPFYFTPSKLASLFRTSCPPLNIIAAALYNANYAVSRSHASAGSIKTDAPQSFIFDVFRKWIGKNPVKESNIKDGSPAKVLLGQASSHAVDMARSLQAEKAMLSDIKLVRYQQNPAENWGPQAKAGKSDGKPAA